MCVVRICFHLICIYILLLGLSILIFQCEGNTIGDESGQLIEQQTQMEKVIIIEKIC